MKTFFAIICTSFVIALMTLTTVLWMGQMDYDREAEKCGDQLNKTCFVVPTK